MKISINSHKFYVKSVFLFILGILYINSNEFLPKFTFRANNLNFLHTFLEIFLPNTDRNIVTFGRINHKIRGRCRLPQWYLESILDPIIGRIIWTGESGLLQTKEQNTEETIGITKQNIISSVYVFYSSSSPSGASLRFNCRLTGENCTSIATS